MIGEFEFESPVVPYQPGTDHAVSDVLLSNWWLGCSSIAHLTLLHSERPKLYTILAFLSAVGLNQAAQLYRLVVLSIPMGAEV